MAHVLPSVILQETREEEEKVAGRFSRRGEKPIWTLVNPISRTLLRPVKYVIGSSDVISRIHRVRRGGEGHGGGGASRRRILPDTVSPPLVDCVMREARSIIDGTEWRSL